MSGNGFAFEAFGLWDRQDTLQSRFEAWLLTPDGQTMERWVVERARTLRARGFTHYGIGALWESARYDYAVRVGPDADGYKLSNNHRSRMARYIMATYPDLAGFFELRELRA